MTEMLDRNTTRRTFLIAGAAGAAGVAALGTGEIAGASDIAGSTGTSVHSVWRLTPNWGYPLGPSGRISVSSRASRLHAENKVFASEAAARAGRISPCSLAQPYRVEMCTEDYTALWQHSVDGGVSVDMRYPGVAAIMARAGQFCATGEESGLSTATPQAPRSTWTATARGTARTDGTTSTSQPGRAPAGALPITGSSALNMAALGAAMLVVGAGATAVSRRSDRGSDATTSDEPGAHETD